MLIVKDGMVEGAGNLGLSPFYADRRPGLFAPDLREGSDRLQHVVMTFDQFRGRRIYVNGRWTDDLDESDAGRLWTWEQGKY